MTSDLQSPELNNEEDFINDDQVDQVVDAEGDEPISDDENDQEQVEINMSNNSVGFFDAHEDAVFLIATAANSPLVVTGGGDNVAYIWNTATSPPSIVTKLTGFTESVIAGGFTHDASYVVLGDMTGQVRVWKSINNAQKWEFYSSVQEIEEVVSISFHPRQSIFAVTASDGSVWSYSLEPHLENISVMYSHSMPTNFALFVDVDNMDALTLITGSDDGTIVCWNVYQATAIYKIEPEKASVLGGTQHPWVSITMSPSGNSIAVGASDGLLAIIKVDNGQILTTIETGNEHTEYSDKSLETLSWSSGNILAAGNISGEIQLYEVGTWKLRRTIKLIAAVTQLHFLNNSPYLLSSDHYGALDKWDVRSGDKVWSGEGHSSGILRFALQNNENRIITGDYDGVCLIFDM